MHHPWRAFRESWPDVALAEWALADDVHAFTDGETVWMHPRLLQAERRVAICHEVVHLEAGEHCAQDEARERAVDREVARRLVGFDALAAVIPWARSVEELADELWVTPDIAQARLDTLWPREVAILSELVADLHA